MNLLTTEQAAAFLQMSTRTLEAWRQRGQGPKFVKVGRSVRYDEATLQKWLAGCVVGSTR